MDWYDPMSTTPRGSFNTLTRSGDDERETYTPRPTEDTQDDISLDDDEDLTPLQYARFHGLSTDHKLAQLDIVLPLTPQSMIADLLDPLETPTIANLVSLDDLNTIAHNEKWTVDREAAGFIASIVISENEDIIIDDAASRYQDLRQLKLEQAILPRDAALDLVQLKERNALRLSTTGMVPFNLDGDVLWTSEQLRLPADLDLKVAQERLDIDAETVGFLKSVYQSDNVDDLDLGPNREKCDLLEPLTPPLLPLSPPHQLNGISGPAAEFELTSTPEDLIAVEANTFDHHIMQADHPSMTDINGETILTPMNSDDIANYIVSTTDSLSSPCYRKRMRDLKLEVPLLSNDVEHIAKRAKTVSWSDEVRKITATSGALAAAAHMSGEFSEGDLPLENMLKPLAEVANAIVESEQLDEVDTIARIAVPEIDEVQLQVPWEMFRKLASTDALQSQQKSFMALMKNDYCRRDLKWPGASRLEKQLPWSPFPTIMGRVQEEPFDDGSFARYMSCMSFDSEIDIDDLMSYRPHWENEEDDDLDFLEPIPITDPDQSSDRLETLIDQPEPSLAVSLPEIVQRATQLATGGSMDMRELLQRRKNELDSSVRSAAPATRTTTVPSPQGDIMATTSTQAPLGEMEGIGGLSCFLRMHGQAPAAGTPVAKLVSLPQQQNEVPTAAMINADQRPPVHQQQYDPSYSVPKVPSLNHQASIVVSSTFLSRHELVRAIQAAHPALDFVERMPLSDSAKGPGNVTVYQNMDEADMTITPNIGLMTTSLQKLKQKPLPGQKDFRSVRDRFNSIVHRYRRLIILVSESRQPGSDANIAELDDRDTEAFNDLSTSVVGHNVDIEAIYVPGGDQQLVQWIIAFIARHCSYQQGLTLLSEETTWERFLRKAGFNAFAAQSILAALKRPDEGLATFVQMTPDQRLNCLNGIIQSDNVLQDVDRLFDKGWSLSERRGQSRKHGGDVKSGSV